MADDRSRSPKILLGAQADNKRYGPVEDIGVGCLPNSCISMRAIHAVDGWWIKPKDEGDRDGASIVAGNHKPKDGGSESWATSMLGSMNNRLRGKHKRATDVTVRLNPREMRAAVHAHVFF
jgi:hypothetical protein